MTGSHTIGQLWDTPTETSEDTTIFLLKETKGGITKLYTVLNPIVY